MPLYWLSTLECHTCYNVFRRKLEVHYFRRACNVWIEISILFHKHNHVIFSSLIILLSPFFFYVQTKFKRLISCLLNKLFFIFIPTSCLYFYVLYLIIYYIISAEYIKICPVGDLMVLRVNIIVNVHKIIAFDLLTLYLALKKYYQIIMYKKEFYF